MGANPSAQKGTQHPQRLQRWLSILRLFPLCKCRKCHSGTVDLRSLLRVVLHQVAFSTAVAKAINSTRETRLVDRRILHTAASHVRHRKSVYSTEIATRDSRSATTVRSSHHFGAVWDQAQSRSRNSTPARTMRGDSPLGLTDRKAGRTALSDARIEILADGGS